MVFNADYKIVDGMTFVRGKGPKGTVVSYGKTTAIALGNLMNKYQTRYKERVYFRLGKLTKDLLESMVTVRRTRMTEWWFQYRERRGIFGQADVEPVLPETSEKQDKSEYVYEVEDGVLKVYRVSLEHEFKIKQTPKVTVTPSIGGFFGQGDVPAMLNANKGEGDVA